MVSLLISALLLFVPAGAWALASTAVLTEYAERRARVDVRGLGPTRGRGAPYFAGTLTPNAFGGLLLYLLVGLQKDFGPPSRGARGLAGCLPPGLCGAASLTRSPPRP